MSYYDTGWINQQAGTNMGNQTPLQYLQSNPGTTPFQGWNATSYLNSNPDLVSAWNGGNGLVDSANPSKGTLQSQYGSLENYATAHYNLYGINEGRSYEGMPISATQQNSNNISQPSLPPGTAYEAQMITPQAGEMVSAPQLDPNGVSASFHSAGDAQTATAPNPRTAQGYQATQIDPNAVPQAQAEQGTVSNNAQVQAQQGTLNPEISALLDKYMADVPFDPRALVQTQYETLTNFDPLNPPGWARGAMAEAMARMSARGLGSSSMAAGAISASILQAALPIASQDAKVFENLMLKKMDQQSQAVFLKAGFLAQMDMKNLDNRQQAAVVNAQAFLSMDLANLANRQQATIINTQGRIQAMLSNQAADNAAKQFNAASANQMTMFYDQLSSTVNMFNASQQNEMAKFNAGQMNTIGMFNASLQNSREQFNLGLSFAAEQSNAQWLRQVNTTNTQAINQQNLVNSQNLLQISNTAMQNELMRIRDQDYFTFQGSQNQLNRDENRILAMFNNDNMWAMLDKQSQDKLMAMIGGTIFKVSGNLFS